MVTLVRINLLMEIVSVKACSGCYTANDPDVLYALRAPYGEDAGGNAYTNLHDTCARFAASCYGGVLTYFIPSSLSRKCMNGDSQIHYIMLLENGYNKEDVNPMLSCLYIYIYILHSGL